MTTYADRQAAHAERRAAAQRAYKALTTPEGLAALFPCHRKDRVYSPAEVQRLKKRLRRRRRNAAKGREVRALTRDERHLTAHLEAAR